MAGDHSREEYLALMDQVHWLPYVTTDFNRPPRLLAGQLVWTARAFAYEDGTGSPRLGELVILHAGTDDGVDSPGLITRVIEVDPKVHSRERKSLSTTWTDHYRYVKVTPVEWERD